MKPDNPKSQISNLKSQIVLVHGAFRGGWAWQKVRRILQAEGLEVFAPSLTGAGDKSHLLSPQISLGIWTDDIANLIVSEDLRDVVLVGHSQGGIVIQAAAERLAERVAKLVFIDAPVLRDGECAIDVLPDEILQKYGQTPENMLIEPNPVPVNEYFSSDEADWFNARLTAVPTNPSLEKIRISNSAEIPHQYVFCSQTPPFFPASFTRQRFDLEAIEYQLIDAPHDCIWMHAEQIAEILLQERGTAGSGQWTEK